MARKSQRPALVLTQEQRSKLQQPFASRVASTREVERSKVMLGSAAGILITESERRVGVSRPMIYTRRHTAMGEGVQSGI